MLPIALTMRTALFPGRWALHGCSPFLYGLCRGAATHVSVLSICSLLSWVSLSMGHALPSAPNFRLHSTPWSGGPLCPCTWHELAHAVTYQVLQSTEGKSLGHTNILLQSLAWAPPQSEGPEPDPLVCCAVCDVQWAAPPLSTQGLSHVCACDPSPLWGQQSRPAWRCPHTKPPCAASSSPAPLTRSFCRSLLSPSGNGGARHKEPLEHHVSRQ